MAGRYGRLDRNPAARLPELFLTIGCGLVAFTGVWLWWFGQDTTGRVVRTNDITDPYAAQVWMRRLHVIGTYGVIAVVVVMIVRAAVRQQGWRMVFLFVFLVLFGIGAWVGYTVDWADARLWSETVGTKLSTGLDLGDGPPLPDDLRNARVHLSIVPAALTAVGLLSFLHYRRF